MEQLNLYISIQQNTIQSMLVNLEDLVKFKEVVTQESNSKDLHQTSSIVDNQLEEKHFPNKKSSMLVQRGYFDDRFSIQSENMKKSSAHRAGLSSFIIRQSDKQLKLEEYSSKMSQLHEIAENLRKQAVAPIHPASDLQSSLSQISCDFTEEDKSEVKRVSQLSKVSEEQKGDRKVWNIRNRQKTPIRDLQTEEDEEPILTVYKQKSDNQSRKEFVHEARNSFNGL